MARRKSLAISDAEWQVILQTTGSIPPTANVARARLEIGACRQDFLRLPISRKKLLAARKELRRSDALLGRLIRSLGAAHRLGSGDLLLVAITDLEKHHKQVRDWIKDFGRLAHSVGVDVMKPGDGFIGACLASGPIVLAASSRLPLPLGARLTGRSLGFSTPS